jgi:hypothetical protein
VLVFCLFLHLSSELHHGPQSIRFVVIDAATHQPRFDIEVLGISASGQLIPLSVTGRRGSIELGTTLITRLKIKALHFRDRFGDWKAVVLSCEGTPGAVCPSSGGTFEIALPPQFPFHARGPRRGGEAVVRTVDHGIQPWVPEDVAHRESALAGELVPRLKAVGYGSYAGFADSDAFRRQLSYLRSSHSVVVL